MVTETDADVSDGSQVPFPVNFHALIRRHSRENSPCGLRQRRSVAAANMEIPDGSLTYSRTKSSVSAFLRGSTAQARQRQLWVVPVGWTGWSRERRYSGSCLPRI